MDRNQPVPLVIYSETGERTVVGEAWVDDHREGMVAKFYPGFEMYGPSTEHLSISVDIDPEAAVVPKPPPPIDPHCKCIKNFGNVKGFTYTAGCPEHGDKGH